MKNRTSTAGPLNITRQISQRGIQQAANGQIVTNPGDRQAIANILRAIGNSPAAMAGIRTEMLNNKYPENMKHEVREHY